jgi:prefoldin subunit 5
MQTIEFYKQSVISARKEMEELAVHLNYLEHLRGRLRYRIQHFEEMIEKYEEKVNTVKDYVD